MRKFKKIVVNLQRNSLWISLHYKNWKKYKSTLINYLQKPQKQGPSFLDDPWGPAWHFLVSRLWFCILSYIFVNLLFTDWCIFFFHVNSKITETGVSGNWSFIQLSSSEKSGSNFGGILNSCVFEKLFKGVAVQQVGTVISQLQCDFQTFLKVSFFLTFHFFWVSHFLLDGFQRSEAFLVFDFLWDLLLVSFIVFGLWILPGWGFLLFDGFGFRGRLSFAGFLQILAQRNDVLIELTRVYHPFVVLPIDMFPVVGKFLLAQLAVVIIGGFVFDSLK